MAIFVFNFLSFQIDLQPVLVVGAGLSAADAVTICRLSGVNVIHVYRNRSAGLDKMLPENVYPEYHEVCHRSIAHSIPFCLKWFSCDRINRCMNNFNKWFQS